MATYIKDLKEDNGDITRPVTEAGAVLLSGGGDLETELAKYVTAENIASTSALTPPVTTNMIADNSITEAKIFNNAVSTDKVRDGAITTAKLADDAVGWKYLGCVHTDGTVSQFDFTLPGTYDNYKVLANAEMNNTTASGAWITLSVLNGTSLLTHNGYLEAVLNTSWSCTAQTSADYICQTTTYPYYSVLFEALCLRGRSAEYRQWMAKSVSGGGGSNCKTTRGNFHQSSGTEPTGFRLRTSSTYIRSGNIYVWGMNNPS